MEFIYNTSHNSGCCLMLLRFAGRYNDIIVNENATTETKKIKQGLIYISAINKAKRNFLNNLRYLIWKWHKVICVRLNIRSYLKSLLSVCSQFKSHLGSAVAWIYKITV